MTYSETLIKRIDSLCKKKQISYNKLATMSGVRQSTINNIMKGHSKNPKIKTLHGIALALNMTLAEFLDYEELNNLSFEEIYDEE